MVVMTMARGLSLRIYNIMEGHNTDRISTCFQYFITALIAINVVIVIIESDESVLDEYGYLFTPFEIFSIVVFTSEYILRLALCKNDPKYSKKRYARMRLAITPMLLIDLAAILPFFISFFLPTIDTRFIRVIRMLRLFRLFKLARYSESLQLLGNVFKAKAGDLTVALFILFIVLVFSSFLMYHAEHEAQPEAFGNVMAAMWWGMITLTTIGYGDTVPITPVGKVIGSGIAVIGIAVYAIPTGIMASAFVEELKNKGNRGNRCPHCGKDLH